MEEEGLNPLLFLFILSPSPPPLSKLFMTIAGVTLAPSCFVFHAQSKMLVITLYRAPEGLSYSTYYSMALKISGRGPSPMNSRIGRGKIEGACSLLLPQLWNSFPREVCLAPSLDGFKGV